MLTRPNYNLKQTYIHDFNLCFFLSLALLSIYQKTLPATDDWLRQYLMLPLFNGLLNVLPAWLLNRYFSRRIYTARYFAHNFYYLALVAFSAGFLGIYISAGDIFTYAVSLLIIYLAYRNIREFAVRLSALLEPDSVVTPDDAGNFANFFINMVITYAAVNLSLNSLHVRFGHDAAFNFSSGPASVIDAIYFSIITMTTVGYGDIIPQTTLARAVVGIECLTSYIFLGIMIGLIVRGLIPKRN